MFFSQVAKSVKQFCGALGVRGVVAWRGVGGDLNLCLQEAHLFVKVGVDPSVELGVLGLAHGGVSDCLKGSDLGLQVVQQVHEGVDGKLHVVAGGGFKWVVADASVLTAYKQHRLRHALVQLHRIVARAAGQVTYG